MKIAVITGASSGMGREFVYALDREENFDEIWVIARRENRLEELKAKCRNPIRPLVWDLEKRESLYAYRELLEKERPEIDVLVNAAGFGLFGTFEEMDMDRQLDIIDLNARALTGLCYLSVPYMKAGGRIWNMGSMSSWQPVPYINVYGASKAYVLSFSRALGKEFDRLEIVEILDLHHKGDDVAACTAAKAMKILLVRMDVAGCGLLIMKRTKTNVIPARAFARYVAAPDIFNGVGKL